MREKRRMRGGCHDRETRPLAQARGWSSSGLVWSWVATGTECIALLAERT